MRKKTYTIKYDNFYNKFSRLTGLSNNEIDLLFTTIVDIMTIDLNKKGEIMIPYIGKFELRRMPARKRTYMENPSDINSKRITVDVPIRDKLRFTVNKHFSKLFR